MMPLERKLTQYNDVEKTRKWPSTCVPRGLVGDEGITIPQFLASKEVREEVVCNLLKYDDVGSGLRRE
jgi:hypothetical protein